MLSLGERRPEVALKVRANEVTEVAMWAWFMDADWKFKATGVRFVPDGAHCNLAIWHDGGAGEDWIWRATYNTARTQVSRQGYAPSLLEAMRAAEGEAEREAEREGCYYLVITNVLASPIMDPQASCA
jgi:hypothetical protein